MDIGPIPKDTPVSLLTSMDLLGADLPRPSAMRSAEKLLGLLKQIKSELKRGNDSFENQQRHGDDALDEQVSRLTSSTRGTTSGRTCSPRSRD